MSYTTVIVTNTLLSSVKHSMDALEAKINHLEVVFPKESDEVQKLCRVSLEKDYAHLAVLKDWYDRTCGILR